MKKLGDMTANERAAAIRAAARELQEELTAKVPAIGAVMEGDTIAAIRFRVEAACDGYENLMDEDVPGGQFHDVASYQSGAADAARAIRNALRGSASEPGA